MGSPMAENILRRGHPLTVFDTDPQKVERLVGQGADGAMSAADVARRGSILISMVQTTAQAEQVIVGAGGFIESAQPGDVVVNMSTIDPMRLPAMRDRLSAKGVEFLDAPVTGAEKGAKEATLKAFVGGNTQAFEKVRPVLEAMTSHLFHMGGLGNGTAMKLVTNMLFQVSRIVVAEALALGTKAGLDPKQMVEVLGSTTANSMALQYNAPRFLTRDFQSPILMEITCKDVELQVGLGKSLGMPTFMTSVAQQVYMMAYAAGLGGEDPSAVVKVYEQFTGVPVTARE
jgi:3-hydroxyisobutyrate dehydrogenase